jgi:hypothetical protein
MSDIMNIRITFNNKVLDTVSNHYDAMTAIMAAWENGTLLPANVPNDITIYRSDDDGEGYPERTIALGDASASCEIELDSGIWLTDEQAASIKTQIIDQLGDICAHISVTNGRIEFVAVDRRFSARPNEHCRNPYEQIDQSAWSAIEDDAERIEKIVLAAVRQYIDDDDFEVFSSARKNYLDEDLDYRYSVLNLESATIDE